MPGGPQGPVALPRTVALGCLWPLALVFLRDKLGLLLTETLSCEK